MIAYRFGRDDLLRTRFAISPLYEVTMSVAALSHPANFPIHRPWLEAVGTRLEGVDLSMLKALTQPHGYTPDFVNPPPQTALPDADAEIERVAATPPDEVRRELALRFGPATPPPAVQILLERPRRGVRQLADLLALYWERAIAPWWEKILLLLEEDVQHRAELLTGGGPIEAFGDLHPKVRWRDGTLEYEVPYAAEIDLDGRGVQLVPSAFVWPDASAMFEPPWQPSLIYPARGVAKLWAPPEHDERALVALLGERRAHILAALDAPASTTLMARRLRASPASVSEHLAVLHRAGLVRKRRAGHQVLYRRTAGGDALLRAIPRA